MLQLINNLSTVANLLSVVVFVTRPSLEVMWCRCLCDVIQLTDVCFEVVRQALFVAQALERARYCIRDCNVGNHVT